MAETDHLLCMLLSKLIEELRIQVSILRDAYESVFESATCSSSACSSSTEQPIFASTILRNAQESVSKFTSSAPPATSAPSVFPPAMAAPFVYPPAMTVPFVFLPATAAPFVFPPATAAPSIALPVTPAPSAYLLIELVSPEALQTLLQQQKANTILAEIKDALQGQDKNLTVFNALRKQITMREINS